MKLLFSFLIATLFCTGTVEAQKILGTRNGKIAFSSPSDEDVKAVNNEVSSRMADNGQITFSLLTKGFKFKLAEMQEHFNDQYIESSKFPRSDFKGNIVNIKDVNLAKDGVYKVTVKGDLNLHGVTKNITANGTIEVKGGKVSAQCQFVIVLKDFNVDAAKVTQKVDVEITCQYD